MAALRRAVFLDRDGTLNRPAAPGDYVRAPDALELIPGAAHAVGLLRRAGYLCVVTSNQRGVALGLMTEDDLAAVDLRLHELLRGIDASYYCVHAIGSGCGCRKPEPGLLLTAAEELRIDLGASWMVGDSPADEQAGRAAGCRTLLVRPVDLALLHAAQTILVGERQAA
jgi:D-glycero-D-manno-heptose 1,7-bisphosphate phosphatase